jgi:hypothetical protein
MRGKVAIKAIRKALKQDHLYSDEEIQYMKKQLKILEEEISQQEVKTSKGFGKK